MSRKILILRCVADEGILSVLWVSLAVTRDLSVGSMGVGEDILPEDETNRFSF